MKYLSHSEDDTWKFAFGLAERLPPPCVFALCGGLGAGKTAFTRGLAAGYGVSERVTSPTFTLMNLYNGNVDVHHFDLYRLGNARELEDIGYYEYIDGDGVCVIEWPMKDALPQDAVIVDISMGGADNERVIEVFL